MRTKLFAWLSYLAAASLALLLPACGQPVADSPWPEPVWTHMPLDLLEKAAWEHSTDGRSYLPGMPRLAPGKTARFFARARFQADHPEEALALELLARPAMRSLTSPRLNGQSIKGPMPGMTYRSVPNVSPGLLRPGINEFTMECEMKAPPAGQPAPVRPAVGLLALQPQHLLFRGAPALGAFDEESFSVTCRTNLPCEVDVCCRPEKADPSAERTLAHSPIGLIHRLKVPRPEGQAAEPMEYFVRAQLHGQAIRERIQLPELPVGKLRFIALGDSRTQIQRWGEVTQAAAREEPLLVVHTGDMVSNGKEENAWAAEFFDPARTLFASTPLYAVIGNHENNAVLYNELFYTPSQSGRSRNWTQTIGEVLLIGIDGLEDWSLESKNADWLEAVLAGSKAKFIFLATHYPPVSSSRHGKLEKNGQLREKTMRYAREVVLPILEEHGATAILAGHDHCYERSESPGGLTVITTGGGGAPLYAQEKNGRQQNPWTRVFAAKHHYCLLEVSGDRCTLTAKTPQGEVLDTRTWTARQAEGN